MSGSCRLGSESLGERIEGSLEHGLGLGEGVHLLPELPKSTNEVLAIRLYRSRPLSLRKQVGLGICVFHGAQLIMVAGKAHDGLV